MGETRAGREGAPERWHWRGGTRVRERGVLDARGMVECPRCGHNMHVSEGEEHREYTGGGFADHWYTFTCARCACEFGTRPESGYA